RSGTPVAPGQRVRPQHEPAVGGHVLRFARLVEARPACAEGLGITAVREENLAAAYVLDVDRIVQAFHRGGEALVGLLQRLAQPYDQRDQENEQRRRERRLE